LGLLTCKNRLPYNLYCVGGDVKHCAIQSNPIKQWFGEFSWGTVLFETFST